MINKRHESIVESRDGFHGEYTKPSVEQQRRAGARGYAQEAQYDEERTMCKIRKKRTGTRWHAFRSAGHCRRLEEVVPFFLERGFLPLRRSRRTDATGRRKDGRTDGRSAVETEQCPSGASQMLSRAAVPAIGALSCLLRRRVGRCRSLATELVKSRRDVEATLKRKNASESTTFYGNSSPAWTRAAAVATATALARPLARPPARGVCAFGAG